MKQVNRTMLLDWLLMPKKSLFISAQVCINMHGWNWSQSKDWDDVFHAKIICLQQLDMCVTDVKVSKEVHICKGDVVAENSTG
jgi:hypothetical protein